MFECQFIQPVQCYRFSGCELSSGGQFVGSIFHYDDDIFFWRENWIHNAFVILAALCVCRELFEPVKSGTIMLIFGRKTNRTNLQIDYTFVREFWVYERAIRNSLFIQFRESFISSQLGNLLSHWFLILCFVQFRFFPSFFSFFGRFQQSSWTCIVCDTKKSIQDSTSHSWRVIQNSWLKR